MKKIFIIILMFLSSCDLVYSQFDWWNRPNQKEFNENINLEFTYTELINGGEFNDVLLFSTTGGWDINSTLSGEAYFNGVSTGYVGQSCIFSGGEIVQLIYSISNSAGTSKLTFAKETGYPFFNEMTAYIDHPDGNYNYIWSIDGVTNQFRTYGWNAGDSFGFDDLYLHVLIPPNNFNASTFDVNNYVVYSSGCKFVETTGITYIEMQTVLPIGYYSLTGNQIYTSGELNAFNGTVEVAFPTSSGAFNLTYYSDGINALRLQVDNNSSIILTKLSIKNK